METREITAEEATKLLDGTDGAHPAWWRGHDRASEVWREKIGALVAAVRREREARAEWLASLPDGSCGNPPPAALIDAEAATGEVLRVIEGAQ